MGFFLMLSAQTASCLLMIKHIKWSMYDNLLFNFYVMQDLLEKGY